MATMQTLSGIDPEPIGNAHFVHVPYNSFTTSDGFVVIAVITNEFWLSLLDIVDIEELRNNKFSDQPGRLKNQAYIEELLNKKLSENTSEYWIDKLNASKVPCAPINSFSKALSDEQVIHRNMVVEVEHPDGGKVLMPGNPVKLSLDNEDTYSPPPKSWANYSEKEIDLLIKEGIISQYQ